MMIYDLRFTIDEFKGTKATAKLNRRRPDCHAFAQAMRLL
jgi:hypothetical protein